MKNFVVAALVLFSINSTFANVEYDEEVCGDLAYTSGSYVLMADHGDNYTVRESKISKESMKMTRLMRIIVQNNDYEVHEFPQACFYGVKSERVMENELDVLELSNVLERRFVR